MSQSYQTSPIKSWLAKEGFISLVPEIRTNKNKYPYITFLKEDNTAENIYFSKNASEKIEQGLLGIMDLKSAFIIGATNADGESRTKISFSQRESIEDFFGE